jgi:hypothetical protein
MTWKCYEKVVHGRIKVGVGNKVLKLQYKETTTIEFISYTKPKLHKFILHNFVAHF